MITRIVKLTFKPEHIGDFVKIWDQSRKLIAGFEGCHFVEMLQSLSPENVCFTYSMWESEEALNTYRNSELFKHTWARTKILFDAKPEAWSSISHGFEGTLKKEKDEKD